MAQGIKGTDFVSFALADVGVSVTRIPVTKEEHMLDGDEILVDGTSTTITAYIVRRGQQWQFDKEGKIEGGDAFMMAASTTTVNVDDKITYDGITYRVMNKIMRRAGPTTIAISYNLFMLE